MKNSFSLLEMILTLIISSIVIIYSTLYSKELFLQNRQTQELEIDKINLLATKIFIEKNKKEIESLFFLNNNLYFGNNLLLEDVRDFHLYLNKNTIKIDINFKNKIIQSWEFGI